MSESPSLSWTKEQRREWSAKESKELIAYANEGNSIARDPASYLRAKEADRQRKLGDESSPRAALQGDILLAIHRFKEATGMSIKKISVDGDKIEASE